MRKLTIAFLALLFPLAGCMAPAAVGEPAAGEGPAAGKPAASSSPAGDDDGTAKIGESYKYDDGIVVEITGTKKAKIGRYAAGGHPGDPMAILTIRVKNGTKSKLSADLATVQVTYGADGDEAESVYQDGLDGFSGTITKGGARSAKYGFAVPKKAMKDVTVEITPDFEHDSAIFKGAI